jgi:hypothetical protein
MVLVPQITSMLLMSSPMMIDGHGIEFILYQAVVIHWQLNFLICEFLANFFINELWWRLPYSIFRFQDFKWSYHYCLHHVIIDKFTLFLA